VTVVLTLALSIGATTAIFSLGDAVLLPLPFPESDRLVAIDILEFAPGVAPTNLAAANNLGSSYPNFFDWQQQNQSSMLSQTRRFVALLSLQRCSDEFSRAHGCRHLLICSKMAGRPEDGRDDLKLSLQQTDSSQRLMQSKRGLHVSILDSALCSRNDAGGSWQINPHSC
jgi:hypothetical protein